MADDYSVFGRPRPATEQQQKEQEQRPADPWSSRAGAPVGGIGGVQRPATPSAQPAAPANTYTSASQPATPAAPSSVFGRPAAPSAPNSAPASYTPQPSTAAQPPRPYQSSTPAPGTAGYQPSSYSSPSQPQQPQQPREPQPYHPSTYQPRTNTYQPASGTQPQPNSATSPVLRQESSYQPSRASAPVGGIAAVQRPAPATTPSAPSAAAPRPYTTPQPAQPSYTPTARPAPAPYSPSTPAAGQPPQQPSAFGTATAPVLRQESSYQPSHAGAPVGGIAAVKRPEYQSSPSATPAAGSRSTGFETPVQPVSSAPVGGIASATGNNVPTLNPDMFRKFSEFIYKISGIRFAENKSYFLASKIKTRMEAKGMTSLEEYYSFLQSPMSAASEHPLLIDEITINETFFFRNQPQLEAFEQYILKPLLEKRRQQGQNRIRIWSCASSTGDEAYTTALQIIGMPEARGMQFEIIGTDICRSAVAQAQAAVYRKYAIRNVPIDMLRQYFVENTIENTWALKPEIKAFVKFQESNLMDEQRIRMLGKFDIAFCRNVLIYFDDISKEKVLWNIYNALNDDGYLLAGHSENLYPQRHIFKQVPEYGQAMAYRKLPGAVPGSAPVRGF